MRRITEMALLLALLAAGASAQDDETALRRLEETRLSLVWRRLPLADGLQWLAEESPVEIGVDSLPPGECPISLALRDASLLDILDLLADFHGFRCRIDRGTVRVSRGSPPGFLRTRRFAIADLACRVAPDPFEGAAGPPDFQAILGPFLHAGDAGFWDPLDGRRLVWRADSILVTHTTRALDEMERRLVRVRVLCDRDVSVSIGTLEATAEAARAISPAVGLRLQVFPTPDPDWARVVLFDDRQTALGVRTDFLARTEAPIEVASGPANLEIRVSAPSALPPLPIAGEPLARRISETTVEVLDFHDQPLSEVVRYLEQQTGLNFAIHPDVFAEGEHDENRISIRLRGLSLTDCLDLISSISRLAWSIEHGAVVIRPPGPSPDLRLAVDRFYDLRFTRGWLDSLPEAESSIAGGRFLLSSNAVGRTPAGLDSVVAELVRAYPATLVIEHQTPDRTVQVLATAGRPAAFRAGDEPWTEVRARLREENWAEVEVAGLRVEGRSGAWLELEGGARVRVTRSGM